MHVLAVLLDRGTVVKRNPAEARLWAERLQANPPPDWGAVHVQVLWARLLVESEKSEDRVRGLAVLEGLARSGHRDARGVLGIAIRNENPVRARALLEQALGSHPGRAIPPLAEMLIRGEGGPKDERRALKLLQSDSTVPGISGALGQLYLEGRLVPRDVGRGIQLVRHLAVWDHDARLRLMDLLAAHPEVRIEHPDSLLYIAIEAARASRQPALHRDRSRRSR
jgi:TPR repeat protein